MDIITILTALVEWAGFALMSAAAVFAVILASYLFYRKKLHGKYQISRRKFAVLFLLMIWFLVVLGLTTLNRGANYADDFNFNLFSGYVNAWNKWSLSELQLILFNMIMFMPLGFLLPLLSRKAERFNIMFPVSLAVTFGIEMIQFMTSTGIFELDDLFHNVLGSIMGYAFILGMLRCLREKKLSFRQIGTALAIPICIALLLTGVFAAYQVKELGNIPILPAVNQDMEDIIVRLDTPLSDHTGTASLFRNRGVNDLERGRTAAKIISSQYDLNFNGPVRIDGLNRIFTLKDQLGNIYYFNYFMQDGTWNLYTETQETALSTELMTAQREELENWMMENEFLQENANFQLQNETILRWDMEQPDDIATRKTGFYEGAVMITLSDDLVPFDFMNTIVEKEYIRDVKIISSRQAFGRVLEGEFEMYSPLKKGDELVISSYEISYIYDTKGYYQPAYRFSGYINDWDHPWSCSIPAIAGAN